MRRWKILSHKIFDHLLTIGLYIKIHSRWSKIKIHKFIEKHQFHQIGQKSKEVNNENN